jgi:hypothetical protein
MSDGGNTFDLKMVKQIDDVTRETFDIRLAIHGEDVASMTARIRAQKTVVF